MTTHYGYGVLHGYGVLLTNPEDENLLIQGVDAENFLNEIAELNSLWVGGINPNPDYYPDYEKCVSCLVDLYFSNCK